MGGHDEEARNRYRDGSHCPDYPSYAIPRLKGYSVQKTIVVTLSDLSKFEDLLSGVLEAGANYVHNVEFRTTELRKHRDQARALAIQAATAGGVVGARACHRMWWWRPGRALWRREPPSRPVKSRSTLGCR